jgi:hypothetical protein
MADDMRRRLAISDREQLRERIRAKLPVTRDGDIDLVARAWAVRGSS